MWKNAAAITFGCVGAALAAVLLSGCPAQNGQVSGREKGSSVAGKEKPSVPSTEHLPFAAGRRPWGDSFLPRSKAPAKELLVVDVRALSTEERVAITCLQGLTSRERPRIWLMRDATDQFWLDWHKQKGYVGGYRVVEDWRSLFAQFRGSYKGAIVGDAKLYRGDLLAINVAACEDLIVATPELAAKLGIPVTVDLRGRFKTYAEGMRWVWATYKDRLNHYLCDYQAPGKLPCCTFSYDVQWRGVVFWIAGPVEAKEPGVDVAAERAVMSEIFSEMPPNIAVIGFPYAGDGVGLGEWEGVKLASQYGKGLVCTDYMGNMCVTSGVRVGRFVQPRQPAPPPLEKDKIYVALAMSDGDNENCWLGFFKRYFEHPSFGKFPMAWGMGPAIQELQPGVAEWYYEHASPTTEFFSDVSGVAYISPGDYGTACANRQAVMDGFLDWTARLMKPMGMRTVRPVGGGDEFVAQYVKRLPFCHSIFADMFRSRNGIDQLTYTLDGMPVFRAALGWPYGKDGFARELGEQVGTQQPAFVNAFVHCWTVDPDALAAIWEKRPADVVFVTPSQLAELYREAKAKGWAK